jgi:hypothetical protein
LGRVVEGNEVLASLDSSHMQDTRKWTKMVRALLGDGNAAVVKDFPKMDSIVRATLVEQVVEVPAEEPTPSAAGTTVPPGMALVRVYRADSSPRKFTLRIDGAARAALAKGTFYEAVLPAGRHELSTKVKFKMFATGLGDKLFAARDTLVADIEPGRVYHVRAAPVGDGQTLQLLFVASDFGAEECKGLTPAEALQGTEAE